MKNSGTLIFLLTLVVVLASCTTNEQGVEQLPESVNSQDDGETRQLEELAMTYANLQNELTTVIGTSGEISQSRYEEIMSIIQELETAGYPAENVNALKSKMERIKKPVETIAPPQSTSQNTSDYGRQAVSNGTPTGTEQEEAKADACESNEFPVFTHHITDFGRITSIQTPPMIVSGFLKTHSYIETNGKRVPVYAPVDMTLVSGSFYVNGPYTLNFKVGCGISLRFGHITQPIDEIKEVFQSEPAEDSRDQAITKTIRFRAGDIVAYTTGTNQAGNWDFGVYNSGVSNRYAASPDWSSSPTYTTAVCPFDYFTPELRSEYADKYNLIRQGVGGPDGQSFCE